VVAAAVVGGSAAGCSGGVIRGAPLSDPAAIARRAVERSGTPEPVRVVFEWEYADERGNLRGEGVGRVNPRDRFRLDLFTTGEGSLRAALVDDALAVEGDIEDFVLPPPAFLYAMTGVFRPGPVAPTEGFESDEYQVLGYPVDGGGMRYFYLLDGKLRRLEERADGRTRRLIELEWGSDPIWPREARYRDNVAPSRVRWDLDRVVVETELFGEEIYRVDPYGQPREHRARGRLLQLLGGRRAAEPYPDGVHRAG
jgi:hypothetical protein